MGTDAKMIIELVGSRTPYASPYQWAEIFFQRDYRLFDLLAGARSDEPGGAAIPIRKRQHETLGEVYEASLDDLKQVEEGYIAEAGTTNVELRAIISALEVFAKEERRAARALFYFF